MPGYPTLHSAARSNTLGPEHDDDIRRLASYLDDPVLAAGPTAAAVIRALLAQVVAGRKERTSPMLTIPRRITVIIADPFDPDLVHPGAAVYVRGPGNVRSDYILIGSIGTEGRLAPGRERAPADRIDRRSLLEEIAAIESALTEVREKVSELAVTLEEDSEDEDRPAAPADPPVVIGGRPFPPLADYRIVNASGKPIGERVGDAASPDPLPLSPPLSVPPSPIESHSGIRWRELTPAERDAIARIGAAARHLSVREQSGSVSDIITDLGVAIVAELRGVGRESFQKLNLIRASGCKPTPVQPSVST